MKVIYPNKISSVAANYADSEFPVANVLDDHVKRLWKSTGNTGRLTISVDGGSSGIIGCGIFETNAIQVIVTVRNSADTTTILSPVIYDTGATTWYGFITGGGDYFKNLWHEYSTESDMLLEGAHKIRLDFTSSAGTQVYCGAVRAGLTKDFQNPQYGLSEGLKDFSIVKELNNGSRYYRKRNIARTFSGTVIVERNPDFYKFAHDVAQTAGAIPLAWLLYDDDSVTTTDEENRWAIFAYLDSMPTGTHNLYSHSDINFSLTEAV